MPILCTSNLYTCIYVLPMWNICGPKPIIPGRPQQHTIHIYIYKVKHLSTRLFDWFRENKKNTNF